jgi:hypothetical protein
MTFGQKTILSIERHVQDKRYIRCRWIDRPPFNCCACDPVTIATIAAVVCRRLVLGNPMRQLLRVRVRVRVRVRLRLRLRLANAPPGGTTYCTSLARSASCAEKIHPVSIMSDIVP